MSARTDALLWAQRVVGRKGTTAHQILDIPEGSGLDVAQEAFHRIARMAHPDLHRTTLSADELELVTSAYARAAAAYHEFRAGVKSTARIRALRESGSDPARAVPTTQVIPTSATPNKAVPIADEPAPAPGVPAMSSKALVYYRRAELCLRRGQLSEAVLQLKMAIASDPQSALLRSALAEVEAEVRKKP
jgi:tetratricopeptide (TPR) repeat protein